jgi:glycogen synthase
MRRESAPLKILILSHSFLPTLGGLENVSAVLAREFARRGQFVRLVTQTPSDEEGLYQYQVIRKPSISELFSLTRWCDVCFQNNLSLRSVWFPLLIGKPLIVTHQTWISRQGFSANRGRMKHWMLRFATINVSISQSIADHIESPSVIIPNPYDDDQFRSVEGVDRNKDLIFVGRLVADKGAALLLRAVASLEKDNLRPTLTVVGSGPEGASLSSLACDLGIDDRVQFAGVKRGRDLATLFNAHRILVVPSVWSEPFGIVALEGVACGCVVVGSDQGGLKDAIGSCGITFPNGDLEALANRLKVLLSSPESLSIYKNEATAHLEGHASAAIADAYLRLFKLSAHHPSLADC